MCLGIPGEVVEVRETDGLRYGSVRFGGITREVCLECQPTAVVGDFVLVHVGMAIAIIDREEAARTYAILEELGQTAELFDDLPPEQAIAQAPKEAGSETEQRPRAEVA